MIAVAIFFLQDAISNEPQFFLCRVFSETVIYCDIVHLIFVKFQIINTFEYILNGLVAAVKKYNLFIYCILLFVLSVVCRHSVLFDR